MNEKFLEQFYENVILPHYGDEVRFTSVTWKDHGKVDLDAWAHYFEDETGREYVLLYEDFPGSSYLDDGLTHEVVKRGDDTSIELKFNSGNQVPNVIGWFTLFRESRP